MKRQIDNINSEIDLRMVNSSSLVYWSNTTVMLDINSLISLTRVFSHILPLSFPLLDILESLSNPLSILCLTRITKPSIPSLLFIIGNQSERKIRRRIRGEDRRGEGFMMIPLWPTLIHPHFLRPLKCQFDPQSHYIFSATSLFQSIRKRETTVSLFLETHILTVEFIMEGHLRISFEYGSHDA